MRLALLGATGGVGGHVLDWALDAGHTVHALARPPGALSLAGQSLAGQSRAAGLTVTAGDALDPVAVAEAGGTGSPRTTRRAAAGRSPGPTWRGSSRRC
jgi:uncharacterized protein YbjT (DUF2867 family)